MSSHFVAGIDVGTSSIKVAIAENEGGSLVLREVFKESSRGLRRGAVADLAEASQGINRALARIKKFSKAATKNIFASIGTHQVKVQPSRGIVAVSRADTEIYQDDIDRAMRASQAVNLAPNRTIIHNVTREFVVDGVGDIADPLGLSGNRLEVQSLIVDAFSPDVKNLVRLIELGGGSVSGLVFTPLVASRAALSKSQRDLGVALIDIGHGTTGLAVYEENKLVGAAKFPVGAGNVTNDIAIGLKIPVPVAEDLKLNYGYAIARDVGAKDAVDLKKLDPEAEGSVSRRFVSEIVESRLAEIFDLVNNELKLMGKAGQLPGGAVLVGGGAKLPGIAELAKQKLKLASQIGMALTDGWEAEHGNFTEFLEDPEYVNVSGLVQWGIDESGWTKRQKPALDVRNFFRFFIP